MQCKNCKVAFEGNYCPNCGQNATVKRIDSSSLWQEVIKTFTNLEYGLFYTMKELTIRPIQTVKNYLAGQRIAYFPPFKYFFLAAVFYFGLLSLFGYLDASNNDFEKIYIQSYQLGSGSSGLSLKSNQELETIIKNALPFFKYFYIFWILGLAFFFKIFFKKQQYNYAENVVALVYWLSHMFILSSLWSSIFFILKNMTSLDLSLVDTIVGVVIGSTLLFYPIKLHYNTQHKIVSIIKVILSYILSFSILLLLVFLIIVYTSILDYI